MPRVLIVDDQEDIRTTLSAIVEAEGYEAVEAADGRAALSILARTEIDAMLLDIKMPGIDGIEVLERAKKSDPRVEIIMISAHGDIDTAMRCVRMGAYDFIPKPLDQDQILVDLANALDHRALRRANRDLQESAAGRFEILGSSAGIEKIRETIDRVAPTHARVLILGENGTGKELVARSIHYRSGRAERGKFVDVNCAAIPAPLIESELFGHTKGAFTGATEARIGKFQLADGGTIFLDEIGDMSLDAQAKVLRVLEENEIRPVGANDTIPIDARVLAATNKDLAEEVEQGTFREDLLYRLDVVPIVVPPLRERPEDIPELVEHFLVRACRESGIETRRFTDQGLARLAARNLPGNVRQLRNLVERLVILAPGPGPEITHDDVETLVRDPGRQTDDPFSSCQTFEEFKLRSEALFLERKLEEYGWNIKHTAEQLGMQRSNLYKKLEKYGLRKP